MIAYSDIIRMLKEAGYSTYRIRTEHLLSESTLTRIRNGQPLDLETVEKICKLLDCEIQDVVQFKD